MKKHLLLFIAVALVGISTRAQLVGTFDIPGPDFATVQAAIASLNTNGVTAPGVIFNIAAGYTETFTSPLAGVITTTTSDSTKPIIFQKSGTGANPLITAGVGTTTSRDAIFALGGTDWVTFDGINIKDRSTNTTSEQQMEYGFWLAKASTSDGSQHITIINCKISGLSKNYHIGSTSTTLAGATANPISASGANSYFKMYNDSLVNTLPFTTYKPMGQQIYLTGGSSTFPDLGCEIGVGGPNYFLNSTYFYVNNQQYLKVYNNVFTTIDGSQCVAYNLINISSGYDCKVIGNTVGNFTFRNTASSSGVIYTNSALSCEVANNTIQNINHSASTTGNLVFFYYNTGGYSVSIHDNFIINNTIGGSSTTTGYFGGFYIGGGNMASNSFFNVYNNTISGNTITSSSASAVNYFIYNAWYGWSSNIYNNTITNNIINCNGTTNAMDIRCITANLQEKKIYGNTISNFTGTNGTFYGIRHSYGLRTYIYKNKISNVTLNGPANPVIYGITVEDANTSQAYVYNNYISELYVPQSAGTRQVTGINIVAGQLVHAYYNTVYLDASSTGTDFGTTGIFANTTSLVRLQNNIIDNNSSPAGTGRTIALQYASNVLSNFDLTSNNNNYYAGIPGRYNLIYYDGTNLDTCLQTYQVRVAPAENSSITENSPFIDLSGHPYNLHLNTAAKTQCESAGIIVSTPVSITNDYYATPRYPNPGYPLNPAYPPTRPDIGAEEIAGTWNDASAPNITYTALQNTASTSDRVLLTTITDMTGVPTSGTGLPVLYWNINGGSWSPVTASFLGGDQYSFTFGGGVSLNDSIRYFIVAQDTKLIPGPNVGSTPIGANGCTPNPPAFGTPPSNPGLYKIVQGLCGSYNVGVLGDYTTLTAALADLGNKAVSCPVTLFLLDDSYPSETFPIVINNYAGLSSSNTLTIRPAPGASPVITGSNAISLLTLNGVNWVTIDGSNSGGTDRNLFFNNTNTTGAATTVYFSSPGGNNTGASNDVLKNCRIKASPQVTNTTYGVRTNSTTGGGYTNLVINNNEFCGGRIGIRIQGTLAYPAINCQVINNKIGTDVDTNSIQLYGIYNLYADNTLIKGNDVMGTWNTGNSNSTQVGIFVYTLATNTKVIGNKVHGLYNNSASYGIMGIEYRAEGNTVTEISNNVIYDLRAPGSATLYQDMAGISVLNGGNVNIWNNTINLSGNWLVNASKNGCIVLSNAVQNIDIRNNILVNSLQAASGSPAAFTFGVYTQAGASIFSALDYNDYYITGIGANIGELNNATNYATLADWKAATGKEAHAANLDPAFTAPGLLVPTNYSLDNLGVYLPGVLTDITGATRSNPPDMGAYEFQPSGSKTLNLVVFLEGFFSTSTGEMIKTQNCQDGLNTWDNFTGSVVDTLTILLANPTSPWEFVYNSSGVPVLQNGAISVTVPASFGDNYYVAIRHRSGVETWSANPLSFAGASINYNFTNAPSQAFGNNLKQLIPESSIYGIFTGDITGMTGPQDGYIDIFDNNDVFNAMQNSSFGYLSADLTGDAFVDIFDLALAFNNMQISAGMNTPPNPGKK